MKPMVKMRVRGFGRFLQALDWTVVVGWGVIVVGRYFFGGRFFSRFDKFTVS